MTKDRVHSIDIFRGLTIFTMVFVNDVARVQDLPQWMKHMPSTADAMTFVDIVFPAFLFIVGMAIPFAVRIRLEKKEESRLQFWKHVLIRTAGLLILGFYMVNAEEMNREATLIPSWLWNILLYTAAIMIWMRYPRTEDAQKKWLFRGLQITGAAILVFLAIVYKKGNGDELGGMTPSWWGILGLIGWAYLITMVLYMLFRRSFAAMIGLMSLLFVLSIGLMGGGFSYQPMRWLATQTGDLVHAGISMCGLILGMVLQMEKDPKAKIGWMVCFGLLLFVAGFVIRPLYGISKIFATPSWALLSAAICSILFPLIYYIVDIKGWKSWATFLHPAGYNPLLTYIIPFIIYAVIGYRFVPESLNVGITGVLISILFSLAVLLLAALLTRWKIRLKL